MPSWALALLRDACLLEGEVELKVPALQCVIQDGLHILHGLAEPLFRVLISKALVFGAKMILAQYSGFKAIDLFILDNVVIALRLKW